MQLPPAISGLLGQHAISPRIVSAESRDEHGVTVRPVLLSDASGKVLALVGTDSLLDLGALDRFAGREFNAAPDDGLLPLLEPLGLSTLPAIPGVLDLPVLADRRLFQHDAVLLPTGAGSGFLRLQSADFRRVVESAGATIADYTVALAELPPVARDPAADEQDIGRAVEKFTTLRIQKRLEDTLDFPPLPEVAHRIIQLGADPYASVKELASVIQLDPGLAAQVVSWASSPYYAAPGKIGSIQDAIVRVLGFDLVMNLALGLALGKTLRLPREGRYGYRNYWVQAVNCAALVEGLGRATPSDRRSPVGFAYLSGLLHNFGFLIEAELFKPQLQMVCRYAEANPHLGHGAAEQHLLGVTREQMAAWLMRFWHLPEPVCSAIRHQQEPALAGEHEPLALLLNLSGRLLRQEGIGSASAEPIPNALFERLGIRPDEARAVVERVRHSGADLQALARDLAA